MLTFSMTFLQTASPDNQLLFTGLSFAAVIFIFYFLIIRPQNKKQKELDKMLKDLKKGDKVVTIGGLRGVVERATEETVFLKVDEGSSVTLEVNRRAIANLLNAPVPQKEGKAKKADKVVHSATEGHKTTSNVQ